MFQLTILHHFFTHFIYLLHPFFVSVIDVTENAKANTIEVSIKCFADDIEKIIQKNGATNFDISNSKNKETINKEIANYCNAHFQLSINNKPSNAHFIGYEIVKESIWIYEEINNTQPIKNIEIRTNWLFDVSNKQVNIFNVTANSQEKNFKLEYPITSQIINW
jgi:hypothetical protein